MSLNLSSFILNANSVTRQNFAQFASTEPINLGDQNAVKMVFDHTVHASQGMKWSYNTINDGIPIYNWRHSLAGFYKLSFTARTTTDNWRILAVSRLNSPTNGIVGNSTRMGSNAGSWGYNSELIYKVENVFDNFSLWQWAWTSSGGQSDFRSSANGTIPNGFLMSPQDGGGVTWGYFASFIIEFVSAL